MKRVHAAALLSAIAAASAGVALARGEAFTDPAQAPVDYWYQGEYSGQAGKRQFGLQVIALGEGAFDAVLLPGGLPGAGWDGKTRLRGAGKLQGEQLPVSGEGWSLKIDKNGAASGSASVDGAAALVMKRVVRQSPTLGAKPPEGALVLFDGSSAAEWVDGKLTPEGLLRSGSRSRRKWGTARIHLEFRTPFQPTARGQARGNSGVYLADLYEVQILDSFGLEGESNECGGVYRQARPALNMALPPLQWQTYDIDYTAAKVDSAGSVTSPARVTLRHNGVIIHNDLTLQPTPGGGRSKEDGSAAGLYVQDHGDPVVLRNIWVVSGRPF